VRHEERRVSSAIGVTSRWRSNAVRQTRVSAAAQAEQRVSLALTQTLNKIITARACKCAWRVSSASAIEKWRQNGVNRESVENIEMAAARHSLQRWRRCRRCTVNVA
jgi:hypothetical protein